MGNKKLILSLSIICGILLITNMYLATTHQFSMEIITTQLNYSSIIIP